MTEKRIVISMSLLVFAFVLGAVEAQGASKDEAGAKPEHIIKVGSLAPEGSLWGDILVDLKDIVYRDTNGRVRMKLYLNGVMGDEPDMVRKMNFGQLQMAGITINGLMKVVPEIAVTELPFLFQSTDEIDHIRETFFDTFDAYFQKKRFKLLAILDQSPHVQIYTNKPVRTLEDLRKLKNWVWSGEPVAQATWEAMGVKPIPTTVPEALTALQTGLLNAISTGPYSCIALQWFTKIKYVLLLDLRYETAAVIITMKMWDRLGPEIQKVLLDGASAMVEKEVKGTREAEAESLRILEERGKTIIRLTPEEKQPFIDATRSVYDDLAGKLYPPELLDEILASLESYRSGKGE